MELQNTGDLLFKCDDMNQRDRMERPEGVGEEREIVDGGRRQSEGVDGAGRGEEKENGAIDRQMCQKGEGRIERGVK